VMTLLKSDLMEEYPLMADVYLLNSLSTFEAAAPALLVRSPAAPVICEFRLETAELTSEGIFEMAESTFERTDEGALVIALIPELISPITLVAPAATEVRRLLTSVRSAALATLAVKRAAARSLNCMVEVVVVGLT